MRESVFDNRGCKPSVSFDDQNNRGGFREVPHSRARAINGKLRLGRFPDIVPRAHLIVVALAWIHIIIRVSESRWTGYQYAIPVKIETPSDGPAALPLKRDSEYEKR